MLDPAPSSSRPAARVRRPGWRDPRLLVGLLLVLGSVVAGASAVRAADDTVPVLVARHALTPGQALSTADVAVTRVRLGDALARYLPPAGRTTGAVVVRPVPAGELVPASAVGAAAVVDLRPVAVPAAAGSLAVLRPGSLVDVWVARARPERSAGFERPARVAAAVTVQAVDRPRSGLGAVSDDGSVRLLVPPQLVAALIEAVDNDARITVLPLPAGLPGEGS